MTPAADPHIYFIRPAGQDGPIKVGHSIQVPLRLRGFNKVSPVPLELAAIIPVPDGSSRRFCEHFEWRFHMRYADHRLHHEWFAAHPLILADIAAINAGTFDTATLPLWLPKSASAQQRLKQDLAAGRIPLEIAA